MQQLEFYKLLTTLPKYLQTTLLVLRTLNIANATEVCNITHKARAVESAYANQLVIMGYLKKERQGRKAYFYPGPKKIE